jgi:hypothetical protein
VGLIRSAADPCLYYKRSGNEAIIVCIYVNDILVVGSNSKVINITKAILENYLKELKQLMIQRNIWGFTLIEWIMILSYYINLPILRISTMDTLIQNY